MPKDKKVRKRMVVEEVKDEEKTPEITAPDTMEVPPSELAQSLAAKAPIERQVKTEMSIPEQEIPAADANIPTPEEVTEIMPQTVETPTEDTVSTTEKVEELPINANDEPTISAEPPQTTIDPIVNVQEDSETSVNEPVPQIVASGGPNPLVIIVPGIFLLGALLGGIYYYQNNLNKTAGIITTSPTPLAQTENTPMSSASPSAIIDLSKYPINILNGSGIAGEAGKLKTVLAAAGFNITGTGNASTSNFTKTIIKAKSDVPADFITKLSDTLSKTYVLDTNQVLATSSADKVQVIIGSSKDN